MEHRWDVRRTVFLDVSVYRDNELLTHCSSGDVSRGGLFLDNAELQLPVNAPVELEVLMNLEQGSVGFHFQANVIHCSRGGTGLMFRRTRAQLSNALMDLLADSRMLARSLTDGFTQGAEVWVSKRQRVTAEQLPAQFY